MRTLDKFNIMSRKQRFEIINSTEKDLILIKEPESYEYNLPLGKKVYIESEVLTENIQIELTPSYKEKVVISIHSKLKDYDVYDTQGNNIFDTNNKKQ